MSDDQFTALARLLRLKNGPAQEGARAVLTAGTPRRSPRSDSGSARTASITPFGRAARAKSWPGLWQGQACSAMTPKGEAAPCPGHSGASERVYCETSPPQ